jgi:hypothetical protein
VEGLLPETGKEGPESRKQLVENRAHLPSRSGRRCAPEKL